jgi:type I restriction enzyme M protein
VSASGAWPSVALGELTKRISGGTPSKADPSFWTGPIPWVSPKDMKADILLDTEDHVSDAAIQNSATSLVPANTLLCVVRSGILKHSLPLALTSRAMCFNQDITALVPKDDRLDVRYLFSVLKSRSQDILAKGIKPGVTVQSFHSGFFAEYEIPLPPLAIQQEIVAEIEGYQKIIDGARQVVENYRPRIDMQPDWPEVELGSQLTFVSSGATPKGGKETYLREGILFIRSQNILFGSYDFSDAAFISAKTHEEMLRSQVSKGDVFLNITGASIGRSAVMDLDCPANVNQHVAILRTGPELNPGFLSLYLNSDRGQQQIGMFQAGASREALNYSQIRQLVIPLPPLETQRAIVAEIEAEQALVDANKQLIARFEAKIKAVIDRVWGGDTSAPAVPPSA